MPSSQNLTAVWIVSLSFAISLMPVVAHGAVPVVTSGESAATVVVDTRGSQGTGPDELAEAGDWLVESIEQSTGANLKVNPSDDSTAVTGPAIILSRAVAFPELAAAARLPKDNYDAFAIVTQGDRVHILGASESGVQHGVATLLHHWGFRWFAPSPRWHVIPHHQSLSVELNLTEVPALAERRIWYAYGMSGDDLRPLLENASRWTMANRLSRRSLMRTGHSYGNIIGRNQSAFDANPEYYALLPDGTRDSQRAVNARKLCYSNPELIELVANDRWQLLQQDRRQNPAAFMVSVDPSDGEGTCHCENCQRLGTTSDRVFHLANEVARRLRERDHRAWVGLYAYSSHRLPPTIDLEPNVYVQVAMGFNKTQYSLPELVQLWSQKVGAIGLREYYGVEAWDWGLPGRMRGGQVDYHRRWIPYYADRKLNAINAETNANWGAQTLGLYTAAQLMWNPQADVERLRTEYLNLAFVDVADEMREFYTLLDKAPPLRSATLLPLFERLEAAWSATQNDKVRGRLSDLMAYLVYVAKFREFDLVRSRRPSRDAEYYTALEPLMNYAWRIRHRDTVHYYALARRLCNGLPVQDQRLDFYLANKERQPVWMNGESYTDQEVRQLFEQTAERLRSDDDPTVAFSRLLNRVASEGPDAGPSRVLAPEQQPAARFRGGLRGYLVPQGKQIVRLAITPHSRQVEVTVRSPRDEVLWSDTFRKSEAKDSEQPRPLEIELPRANEYPVEFTGDFTLEVPPETPFVFEASVVHPAWISYSGPHYLYIPRGTRELIVDANPRLSLQVPGAAKRLDVHPADRVSGKQYIVIPVPEGADGQVWHTTNMTRGKVSLLNVPPLLSFHRGTILVPREVAESDGLSTRE